MQGRRNIKGPTIEADTLIPELATIHVLYIYRHTSLLVPKTLLLLCLNFFFLSFFLYYFFFSLLNGLHEENTIYFPPSHHRPDDEGMSRACRACCLPAAVAVSQRQQQPLRQSSWQLLQKHFPFVVRGLDPSHLDLAEASSTWNSLLLRPALARLPCNSHSVSQEGLPPRWLGVLANEADTVADITPTTL